MTLTSYQDLKAAVWDRGTCSGCGACAAVCPADAIRIDEGAATPENIGYCKAETDSVPCGACYSVCPRAGPAPPPGIGSCLERVSAKAAFEVAGRQSGGAVTAILEHALKAGLVDAVVTVSEDRWTHKPVSTLVTSGETLLTTAGSRYSWWVPLLSALKVAVVERKYRRVAVIGLPCVVQAIARMRASENDLLVPYGNAVRLVVGLFCTESFDYEQLVEGKLKAVHGIEPWQIRRLDVKGKLEVMLADGNALELPLKELEDCIRPGCASCTDLTAPSADISAGAVGAASGCTTLLVRTPVGKGFVDAAVNAGRLEVCGDVDMGAVERLAARKAARAP